MKGEAALLQVLLAEGAAMPPEPVTAPAAVAMPPEPVTAPAAVAMADDALWTGLEHVVAVWKSLTAVRLPSTSDAVVCEPE